MRLVPLSVMYAASTLRLSVEVCLMCLVFLGKRCAALSSEAEVEGSLGFMFQGFTIVEWVLLSRGGGCARRDAMSGSMEPYRKVKFA